MLENHASVVPASFDLAPIHDHPSAARGVKTHCDAQRRGLAAAGRADQRDDFAIPDSEVDAIERLHVMNFAVDAQGKPLGYVEENYLTHQNSVYPNPSSRGVSSQTYH